MDPRLVAAAESGDVDDIHPLIQEDLHLPDRVGLAGADETPLHLASMCGQHPFVQEMLKLRRQFADDLNQDGFTPLHLASANGNLSVVKELVSASPHTIEMKTGRGETALHLAVKNNQLGALQLLLEHVKKFKKEQVLNEKDHQGNTILHLAASRKQYQVVQLLLVDDAIKSHVELNSKNDVGLTPLDVLVLFSSEAGDPEIHRILVQAGACSDHRNHPPHNNNDDLSDPLGYVLLTLIATATYQAVLSPPCGVWQDNAPDAKPPHVAGKSVLATNTPALFVLFLIGNTIGFFLSLTSIVTLTSSNVIALSGVFYYAILTTYTVCVISITPFDGNIWRVVFLVLGVVFLILPSVTAFLHRSQLRNIIRSSLDLYTRR